MSRVDSRKVRPPQSRRGRRRRQLIRQRRQVLAATLLILGGWLGCSTLVALHEPPSYLNYGKPLSTLIVAQPIDASKTSLRIEKSHYRLLLYYEREPIKAYPVVFGPEPQGDKRYENDGRTPEGDFILRDRYLHPNWSRFLWLDYPTEAAQAQYRQAKQAGQIPAQAVLGGDIAIHGVPQGRDDLIDQRINWTDGSIALKNRDIEELYSVVQVGTKVTILP